jgi:hypothetical protein
MKLLGLIVLLGALLLQGYEAPGASDVTAACKREYPGARVFSAVVGEGDADSAYYHIQYKLPADAQSREDVWLYLKQANGTWAVARKIPGK